MMPNLFGGKLGWQQGGQATDPSQPPAGSGWGQSAAPNGGYGTPYSTNTPQQPPMGTDQGMSGNTGVSYGQPANPGMGYQDPNAGDLARKQADYNSQWGQYGGARPNDAGYNPNQSTGVPVGPPGVVGGDIVSDPFPSQPPMGIDQGGHMGYGQQPPQMGYRQGNDLSGGYQKPQYQPPQYQPGGGYNNFVKQGFGGGLKRWSGGY